MLGCSVPVAVKSIVHALTLLTEGDPLQFATQSMVLIFFPDFLLFSQKRRQFDHVKKRQYHAWEEEKKMLEVKQRKRMVLKQRKKTAVLFLLVVVARSLNESSQSTCNGTDSLKSPALPHKKKRVKQRYHVAIGHSTASRRHKKKRFKDRYGCEF